MPDPQMRAADSDRDAVASRLGEHMSAGRLTVAEYEDRVARAYAAKTYGELATLTADLPAGRGGTSRQAGPAARPQPVAARACAPWAARGSTWRRAAWGSWASTALIVTTIWLITSLSSGAFLYFWPIWVIVPWGVVLMAQTLTGQQSRPGPGQRRLDRERRHQDYRERRRQRT
jgi:hypothetical protein